MPTAFIKPPRPRRRFRLAGLLATSFGLLVLASTTTILALEWSIARKITFEWLNESITGNMEELQRGIETRLDPTRRLIDDLASMALAGDLDLDDGPAIERVLATMLAGRPEVASVIVIGGRSQDRWLAERGPDGTPRVVRRGPPTDEASLVRLADARQRDRTFWGEVLFLPELAQPALNVRRAVRRGNELLGYLGATVTVGQLVEFVDAMAANGAETPFVLYGHDRVLAHPAFHDAAPRAWAEGTLPTIDDFSDAVVARVWQGKALDNFGEAGRLGIRASELPPPRASAAKNAAAENAEGAVIFTKPLDGYGDVTFTLGLYVPADVAFATLKPLLVGGVVGLGLLLLALLAALLLGRQIARSIVAVTRGAARVSSMGLEEVPPLKRSRIHELDKQAKAFNAMLATLRAFQTYVPSGLVQRLITSGGIAAIESEERDLTIMFTDIAGFTLLSERRPATEVAAILNEHFGLVASCIDAEDGTVDKYLGDGLMAFWGAPERVKERAARACRAALAIEAEITRTNLSAAARGRPRIRVRIGLHRGPLVVGNIGAPGRINYTVVGDTVNVAQRLEQQGREVMGEADAVTIVSDAVVKETFGQFRFERLGAYEVRGRREPIMAFRLLGPAPTPRTAAPLDVAIGRRALATTEPAR